MERREARFLHLASIRQPLTELVGRRDEMAALVELIAGAGGCGKTRLVIEVALELSGRFADGAAFVGLTSHSIEAALAPSADAVSSIGYRPGTRRTSPPWPR